MKPPYIANPDPPVIACESYRKEVFCNPEDGLSDERPMDYFDSLTRHKHECGACAEWALAQLDRDDLPRSILIARPETRRQLLAILAELRTAGT